MNPIKLGNRSEKGFLYKINGKLSNQVYEEGRQKRLAWLIRTW